MTVEEMIRRKNELGYSYDKISELSGVPLGTVQKVLGKITKAPRYETLMALEKVLTDTRSFVRESVPAYSCGTEAEEKLKFLEKKQGEYTIDDYYMLPEECKAELIDGVLYDLSSPNLIHQTVSARIFYEIMYFIENHSGDCQVFAAPLDVQFNDDNMTMVEPDIFVVCDSSKLSGVRNVQGAPDLVIEILSRSTWRKDCIIKSGRYERGGVREYWVVDPYKENIIVYEYEKDTTPAIYGFEQEVPVGIYDGKCKIDFRKIRKAIEPYRNNPEPESVDTTMSSGRK